MSAQTLLIWQDEVGMMGLATSQGRLRLLARETSGMTAKKSKICIWKRVATIRPAREGTTQQLVLLKCSKWNTTQDYSGKTFVNTEVMQT